MLLFFIKLNQLIWQRKNCHFCFHLFVNAFSLQSDIEQRVRRQSSNLDLIEDDSGSEASEEGYNKANVFLHYDFTNKRHESTLPVFNARKEVSAAIVYCLLLS